MEPLDEPTTVRSSVPEEVGTLETIQQAKEELEAELRLRTQQLEEADQALRQQISDHAQAQKRIQDYQRKLRKLASQLSLSEAKQRRAIAQELHDHIGQALAFIRLRVTPFHGDAVFCGFEDHIGEILRLLDQTVNSTRNLTFQISPPVLYELGLRSALEWLGEDFKEKHSFSALSFRFSSRSSIRIFPPVSG